MEPGKPGRGMERPLRRKYRRTLPYRSQYSLTYFSLMRVMAAPHAVPAIRCRILPRKRVERQMDGAYVPNLAAINSHRRRHPAVGHHLVELPRGHPDIHCRLISREAAAWNRANLG